MGETTVKVPAELFALAESSRFEGVYPIGNLSIGPDDYAFSEPLTWSVTLTNTGSALLVQGEVEGKGVCACSRCLEDVGHDFKGEVEGYYLFNAEADGYEGEDDAEADGEFDILPDDHILDIAPLLDAALAMNAPEKPLCSENCAGLCPQCGANLNEGPCGCGEDPDLAAFEREANPFSALANFSFE